MQEVELHEASRYGLLPRIPDLLISVRVDAAGYVSWSMNILNMQLIIFDSL